MYWLLFIFAAIILLSVVFANMSLAPWVPTRSRDLKRIFQLSQLKPDEIFYDLGCGNGKTVIYASKNYKAKAIGLEIALPLFFVCKLRQIFHKDKNLIFKFKNLFSEDLSPADVIYFFAMPDKISGRLKDKLANEAKSGVRIISYVFPIKNWAPAVVDKPSEKDLPIYLYKI